MELTLEHFGIIKNAKVRLDGLTIFAGKNDCGKSTVGKALASIVKADKVVRSENFSNDQDFRGRRIANVLRLLRLIFGKTYEGGKVQLFMDDELYFELVMDLDNGTFLGPNRNEERLLTDVTIIESPFVMQLSSLFASASQWSEQNRLEHGDTGFLEYPYLMYDVYGKMVRSRSNRGDDSLNDAFVDDIIRIIDGRFTVDNGAFVFEREGRSFDVRSVASGIQSFGVLSRLIANGWIGSKHLLVVDEPENHLHPEWQVLYAKILVDVVCRLDARVIVATHSPYFLEALKVFASEKLDGLWNSYCVTKRDGAAYFDEDPDMEQAFSMLALPMQKLALYKGW